MFYPNIMNGANEKQPDAYYAVKFEGTFHLLNDMKIKNSTEYKIYKSLYKFSFVRLTLEQDNKF